MNAITPEMIFEAKKTFLTNQRCFLIQDKSWFKYLLLNYLVVCLMTYHLSWPIFLSSLILIFDTIYNWCYTWNMIWNIEGELLKLNEKENSHAS